MGEKVFKQAAKLIFGFPEIGLIDPKRVICIKRDNPDV